jgi:hypothetical protein
VGSDVPTLFILRLLNAISQLASARIGQAIRPFSAPALGSQVAEISLKNILKIFI